MFIANDMKLICTQENLRRAIAVAERATGRQGTLPILGNFLLETENGRLKLSATNLEIGVVARVGAKVETEGKITVSAKLLSNFVANLPGSETVVLESEGLMLGVSAGMYHVKMKGLDAQEFPIIPQAKGGPHLVLPAQTLRGALGRLLPCVALNEARLELTGVNMIFSESEVCLAATDSFRLAEESVVFDREVNREQVGHFLEQRACIVPSATLTELVRVIGPDSREVKCFLEENQLFFEVDGVQIISRLVSGKFPDYKQIIPADFRTRVFLEKEVFLRAVRIASVFATQGVQEIVLRIRPEEKQLWIESKSQEVGENRTMLDVELLGNESVELVFNPRFILDGINAVTTTHVALLANENATPAALRMATESGKIEENFLYIVMPVRN